MAKQCDYKSLRKKMKNTLVRRGYAAGQWCVANDFVAMFKLDYPDDHKCVFRLFFPTDNREYPRYRNVLDKESPVS